MHRAISRMTNAVPTALLRSPAHRLLSDRTLILTFTGRKSGREFTTPVSYVHHDGALVVSTDSPWWRNIAVLPSVAVVVKGRSDRAVARVESDPARAHAALRALVDGVPGYWRPAGIPREGRTITDAALTSALASGRRVIRIEQTA